MEGVHGCGNSKRGDDMRDPERIPRILARIQQKWETYPDLRLGQLLYSLLPAGKVIGVDGRLIDLFYVEDGAWEETP